MPICDHLSTKITQLLDCAVVVQWSFKGETHQIIGSTMEVLNTLGHGLLEKPHENAFMPNFNGSVWSYEKHPCLSV